MICGLCAWCFREGDDFAGRKPQARLRKLFALADLIDPLGDPKGK
jgi:hypothetical protein